MAMEGIPSGVRGQDTLRVKGWTGKGCHLPLYKPEGLVDAFRRDADCAFLCRPPEVAVC